MRKVKRLYEKYKPVHYEILLEPDREKAVFSGRVKIIGHKTGRPSRRITLHQKDLKISSAKLVTRNKSGATDIKVDRINAHDSFDELRLHTSEQLFPGEYEIELEFSGKITEPMHGIYPCNFELDGKKKQLIATQFESHHAREAFPCIDEPEAKATFQLTLVTPTDEVVISNTPIEKQEDVNRLSFTVDRDEQKTKNYRRTTFQKTPKMSTYLLAFAYGELGYKEAKTRSDITVRVYATPDKVALTDFALDTAVRCLDFFEDYYGVPYSLPKQDLIGLPDFSAGAMENWGLITFRESVLFVDPKSTSIDTKQFVAMVVCHELAHMWFGNLVTMKWWNDLWLNESFANLMEYRAVDELYPEWSIWRDFVQREVASALSRDALPNVQALRTEVRHPDELSALFDPSIVYAKGGSLLNMVRNLIGEDAFRKGLKSYFEEFKYANTVADDLWRHLKQASGIPIDKIMENWLTKPGFPLIEAGFDASKKRLSLKQRRLVVAPKPASVTTVWQVPLAASRPLGQDILSSESAELNVSGKDDYPLTLNHDGKSYFVTRYDERKHLDEILKAVKRGILSPIDRLLLVQNYLLLERAGIISTLENILLLPAYENEREETVWGMLAGIISSARNLIDKDESLEAKLNDFIRPIVAPLVKERGWSGSRNDTAQTQKMRALALSLAAVAGDDAVIKEGLRRFKDFKQPSDLAPDVRSAVYFIGVRYGDDKDFRRLMKLYRQLNNADEKDEVAAELTTTRQPDKIKHLLDMIKTDVRLQDASTWFAWLMRNRYATDITWQWLIDNWLWVEQNYATDKSYDRFPRYAAMVFSKSEQLEQYKAFFGPKSSVALERPVTLGIEEIEGRIAWRKRNESPVKDWLQGID